MANKPTQPVFPLGLAAEEQSTLAGVLNTGTIEHGPDAVLTLPEGNASAGLPSSVRYNADSDEFEGFYENGGWLPLGGGGIRWEVLPHASTATLTGGRGYLINNTTGVSTVVLPSPTRVGDSVTICDAYGKFATYPLTVSPSGNNLYGSTEDMAITTDNVSATFTWSGPEQGWIITSGVGLGQGRVYSREIFTKILASETSSVTLNTPPTIVDVYADGKRLVESKYSLDGNVIIFSPSLPASTELQVIEYTPIQLGDVGGSGSSTITWVYNGGSAIGGETEITLDVVVDDVPAIDINGSRQYKNLGFTFDPLTSKITLAQELEPEDEVVVIINGTPNIYNQIDYTLREVARATNVKDTEVVYFSVGAALSGYKVIYDKETQRAYPLPADIVPGTTAVSLSSSAVLVHSAGSVDLGELAVSREEYVTLSGSFDTGVTVNTKNELVVFTDGKYRWDGVLPKEVSAGSTPESAGGVGAGAWVSVGDTSLRSNLLKNNGFSLIGGVRGLVKTSEAGSLLAAIETALANDADVLIDSVQNITTPIRKSLNGKDIKIISTPDGWINFTPTDTNTYYQILTFDGTGVESVTTKVKIDGGKVRGVGRAVVGITVNNVYAHYESSEMRNISACVNTVTAQLHICYGVKYYNVFQQLASQDWSAGVYGYGTVPIDCELVSVDSCIFGVSGAPLDRHAVYCSSQADGTGATRQAFVYNNTAVMRDYTTETAETSVEICFKFIGTNRVHLHHNTLRGGYGFCLVTLHKSQSIENIRIDNNRARTYARGIIIAGQNEASADPDATWYVDELQMADNHFRMREAVAGISNGAEWRNTYRVSDVGSSYVNEAFATVNALAVYYPKTDRIRTESFRSESCYYQGFQNITREMAPTYTYIDISCRNAVNTQNPLNASGATVQNVKVRGLDNTAVWKDYTATAIVGFSYYDPSFLKFIRCAGAGLWEDEDGYPVVGLSTGRPTRLREGLKFYQTDSATMITWTGSNWVLQSAGYVGIIKAGTTSQINAVNKALLGYGHVIYNTDTKKPAFFDAYAQAWKYADGSAM